MRFNRLQAESQKAKVNLLPKSTMHLNKTDKLKRWLASEAEIQKSKALNKEALEEMLQAREILRRERCSLKVYSSYI